MYIDDANEALPPLCLVNAGGESGGYYHTPELLHPYTNDANLWACPSDSTGQSFDNSIVCMYGCNQSRFSGHTNFDGGLALSRIEDPSGTLVFIDDQNLYAGPYSPSVASGHNADSALPNSPTDTIHATTCSGGRGTFLPSIPPSTACGPTGRTSGTAPSGHVSRSVKEKAANHGYHYTP